MITLAIFKWSLAVIMFTMLWQLVRWVYHKIKHIKDLEKMPGNILDFVWGALSFKLAIAAEVVMILSLTLGHIVPYIAQERDQMLVIEYTDNIALYENYSNEYAEAARKQIEEYQAMQSEMARTATVAQLQFWSEQQDVVGNSLTDEIRRFQELIMEQELAINKAKSRIVRRPLNKWYFGINS